MKNKIILLIGLLGLLPTFGFAANQTDWVQPFSAINAGDTAWMLTSALLVLFMTLPGLALFYAGMVRKKNILATILQNFSVAAVVSILWIVIGYSIAFTDNNGFIGGLSRLFLSGVNVWSVQEKLTVFPGASTIPETVWIVFQMTFAIISTAIITGALAERVKFSALLIFAGLWSLIVYAPTAHWVWGGGWLSDAFVQAWTGDTIKDFAGGTVVHINAGIAGLVGALVLGPRIGYGKEAMPPANLTLTLIGASMLWVGWFGFNAGSAGGANAIAGIAMLTTQAATAAGALTWILCEKMTKGKPTALGFASGAISGLVGITPAAGLVETSGALIIGIVTAIACYISVVKIKNILKYDDSLDAFGIHGIGGVVGAILTAIFFSTTITGETVSMLTQILGVVVTIVYSGVMSYILFKLLDKTIGLRVDYNEEREGLDLASHGERIE